MFLTRRNLCHVFGRRHFSIQSRLDEALKSVSSFRACVVGSGPAGFYSAESILRLERELGIPVKVDIIEVRTDSSTVRDWMNSDVDVSFPMLGFVLNNSIEPTTSYLLI
jgi:hypothetical protein